MSIKYSKAFNRDYDFYLANINVFNFCGTLTPKHTAIHCGIKTAKECFYYIDSNGLNYPCAEPELLNALLLCKASVNFQIKEWAQGRADGTFPLVEFSKREMSEKYPHIEIDEQCKTLEWENGEPVYYRDIETQYNLPKWVIDAVEAQKEKYYSTQFLEARELFNKSA